MNFDSSRAAFSWALEDRILYKSASMETAMIVVTISTPCSATIESIKDREHERVSLRERGRRWSTTAFQFGVILRYTSTLARARFCQAHACLLVSTCAAFSASNIACFSPSDTATHQSDA